MRNIYLPLKMSLLLSLFIVFTSCEKDEIEFENMQADALVTTAAKAKPPTEEKAGNNLSFPVIWSDGVSKTIPGIFGEETFNGSYFTAADIDGNTYDYYIQGDLGNVWQAESFDPTQATPGDTSNPIPNLQVDIDGIDWGDNLEAKSWPFGAQIRVEVILFKELSRPMLAYDMKIEDESQSGLTEVWGAKTENGVDGPVGATILSDLATVYSGMAKMVIQKLDDLPENQTPNLTWNSDLSKWEGDIGSPLFEGGVWENIDGPSGYSAEINVQGKVIYGYNWVTRKTGDGTGYYRLTFVLDNNFTGNQNTFFDSNTVILFNEEEEEEVTITAEPDLGGGTAVIVPENNLTYIDVQLVPKNGRGGGNSGAGGGNSGAGGGNNGNPGNGPKNKG